MITEDYNYTIYDKAQGFWKRNLFMPDLRNAQRNCDKDEYLVEGGYSNNTYVYEDKIRITNPKPYEKASWDNENKVWIDTRTEQQIIADKYENVIVTKGDFIKTCLLTGIIPMAELVSVSQGNIPSTFESIIEGMDQSTEIDFRIWWSTVSLIMRSDPKIIALIDLLPYTESQWNQVFGVSDAPNQRL